MPAGAGSPFVSLAVASHLGALFTPRVACDPHLGRRAGMPRAVLQPLPPPFLLRRCAPQAKSLGRRGRAEAQRPVCGCWESLRGVPAASTDSCVVPPSRGFLFRGGRKEVSGWGMSGRRGGGSHVAVQCEAAPVATSLPSSPLMVSSPAYRWMSRVRLEKSQLISATMYATYVLLRGLRKGVNRWQASRW